jgi:hypothetical protein
VPPPFIAVSMNVSTPPEVLAACSTTLVISPSTVVLLALIFPSSKLRDNNGASAAPGSGNNNENNIVELQYLMLSLLTMVVTMSPLDGTLALIVVAGCKATAVGKFGSVVLFAIALVGVLCSKRLHFAAPLVTIAVLFAAAGLTVAGLLGLVAAAIPYFGLCLVLTGGAMVVDVVFGLWLCVLCQICQIHCYVEE